MRQDIAIIKTKDGFRRSLALVNSVVNLEKKLPQQVFHTSFGSFKFEEFDWAMSADFWMTIQQLASETLDPYILMAVIEPSPKDYFYQHFGYYNWFELPVNLSADDYWDVLELVPEDSPADALLFNSDRVLWTSPSKKWAIWGERSCGVCVLATRNTTGSLQGLDTWLSVDQALENIIPFTFANLAVPREFADSLKKNYSL